jgi:AraC-like DNA-binding protein
MVVQLSGGDKMNHIFDARVLQCIRFRHKSNSGVTPRKVMDYEFDFCVGCNREMWIDGNHHKIKKGSFVIRKPGQVVFSEGIYDCYMLTLDFSNRLPLPKYSRNTATAEQKQFVSKMWEVLPSVFEPSHYEDYQRIFEGLLSISEMDMNENPKTILLVNELLHILISDAYLNISYIKNKPKTLMDDICSYIKSNYMNDITLDNIADFAHLNKNYLVRQFKKKFGISPISYLINTRLEYAKKFLAESNLPVKIIAQYCGYNDPSFFSSYFKKVFDISPAAYRHSQQTDGEQIIYLKHSRHSD